MSKPFYQDASVTIYHGDCTEVDAWLAGDVLVTDPPFGIAWKKSESKTRSSRAHAGIQNDHSTETRDTALSLWGDRPGIVFASLYAPLPNCVRHICIWEKPNDAGVFGSTTGFRRDVEAICLTGQWPRVSARWGSVLRSVIRNVGSPTSPAGRSGHPHAKPVDLICTLIQRGPAGVIVDPFAGSGSTLVAAKSLGRKAIGIEIDERYCEIAARRCSQETLDLVAR